MKLGRARRGAPRVPVWRPAFQGVCVVGVDGVGACAARSAAVPVWRPAFQAVCVVGVDGGAACAARSAAGAGLETGVPRRLRAGGGWGWGVRGAERRGCRSGDRRSKPSACWGWMGLGRARRGAPRVPVWRPAFQGVCVLGVDGVGACAARSAAGAGLETGVPSRMRRGGGWGCAGRKAATARTGRRFLHRRLVSRKPRMRSALSMRLSRLRKPWPSSGKITYSTGTPFARTASTISSLST